MDRLLASLGPAPASHSPVAPPPHTQTANVAPPAAPPAFPDLLALARARPDGFRVANALTLLAVLAPERVGQALRPAFGDIERRRLLDADAGALKAEYEALGLLRKKKFGLEDLRALLADPARERDAWARGDVDALAPLLAFVGRRLDAEVEVNGTPCPDLNKRRPRRLCATWDGERLAADLA